MDDNLPTVAVDHGSGYVRYELGRRQFMESLERPVVFSPYQSRFPAVEWNRLGPCFSANEI